MAGKIAVPHLLLYVACKFALVGFSDGLRAELRRQNILGTTASPGLMRTGSPRNAIFKGQNRKEYAWVSISDSLPLPSMSAERAARWIIAACQGGRARLVLGAHVKSAVVLNEIVPGLVSPLLFMVSHLLPGPMDGTSEIKMGSESESRWSPSPLTG